MNTTEKTNVLKPRVFETAAFIASIQSGKSMPACAMNTFKTSFFFLQDKVANIWCSISVLIKVKRVLTQTQIIKLRLVNAFYARDWSMLCQSALWDLIGDPFMAKRHFHLSHNAPYLLPKILHKHCFQFLLGRLQYPGETKNKGYAEIWSGVGGGGANMVHYGKCVSGV